MEKGMLSASIVVYGGAQQAIDTVNSVLNNTQKYPISLYVIDNFSPDDTADKLGEIPDIKLVVKPENVGFGAGHNTVLGENLGKYHAVINPDIELNCDALSALVDIMEENEDIAMITPRIIGDDGNEQHLPKRNPTFKYLFLGRLSRLGGIFKKIRKEYTREDEKIKNTTDIEFCTGCFFLIRSEIFEKIGGFDKRYFMYMEDADLSRRLRAHGTLMLVPQVTVTHRWEKASGKSARFLKIHLRSMRYYFAKWRKRV